MWLFRPCVGTPAFGVPPLCKWSELNDGTYSLLDVHQFHRVLDKYTDAMKPD